MAAQFVWIQGKAAGFAAAEAVRRAVFCAEQGFSLAGEFDAVDGDAWHVVGYMAGSPACTGRIFFAEDGSIHLGRLAVKRAFRGQGLGGAMLAQMLAKARALGAELAILDAQADKQAFYEKAGFAATGKTGLDEGMPHVEMAMRLQADAQAKG